MKSRKVLQTATLILCLLLIVICMAGCGGEKKEPVESKGQPAVAFVIANTANAKPADISAPLIQDTVVDCAEKYGYVFAVRVDGECELVLAEDLDIDDQFKKASPERLKIDARNKATNVLSSLEGVKAKYPEVDFLEGIRLAASALRSLDNNIYTTKSIVCSGSGLGTSGYLNFNNNLMYATPETVACMLQEKDALPDLDGITVYWMSMGQVESPQGKLTPKQGKHLEAIWKAVIEASGGKFVPNGHVAVEDNGNGENDKLPSVSVIDLPQETPVVYDPIASESVALDDPLILSETQVQFIEDKEVYLNESSAVEVLRPIANYLVQRTSVNLLIIGTTAGDNNSAFAIQLSQDRADTVKSSLVELGVDETRIKALGMGSADPWHIPEAGYEGNLASCNRKCVLLDAASLQAQEILNGNIKNTN